MKSMHLRSIILSTSLLIPFVVFPTLAGALERMESADLEFNLGSRVDQLDWNIARDINGIATPNILSELTWNDLEIIEVNTRARIVMVNDHVPFATTLKASVNYGEIQSGDNQDSDYHLDNRGDEWSRSNNGADRGDVWDFTLAFGVVLKKMGGRLIFTPLVGVSQHNQNLTIHDGVQTIPDTGSFSNLDSTYDARWRSGWLGCDLDYQLTSRLEFHGTVEYHLKAGYEAEANWNLRTDFAHPRSFTHKADTADGLVAGFGGTFEFRKVLINLDLKYQKWQAEDGVDTTYFWDGTSAVTKLNEVNWESLGVSTGVTFHF